MPILPTLRILAGLTTESDMTLVRNMVMTYMRDPRTMYVPLPYMITIKIPCTCPYPDLHDMYIY